MSVMSRTLGVELHAYLRAHGVREPEPVRRLRLATDELDEAQWKSSPEQVQLITLLARIAGARSFLEVGTFTGYCSLWMALTLPDGGTVVTCDVTERFAAIGRPFWHEAGVDHRIDLRLGAAEETLDTLLAEGRAGTFDIAYIDANKKAYPAYYEQCLQLVRGGGLVLADNMFWGGAVVDPADRDKSTAGIRALAARAAADDRVDIAMVPITDGLLITRKR